MMNAADRAMTKAIHALEAARPQSGYMPETEEEWNRLVAANEKLAYAMYLKLGQPKAKARALARMTNGGAAGRLLLEMSLASDADAGRDEAVKKAVDALRKTVDGRTA